MTHIQTFQVFPDIPKPLAFLEELSQNIWWCWNYDAVELFRRIDTRGWDKAGRNPLLFSTYLPQERLKELSEDKSFLAHLNRVRENYHAIFAPARPDAEYPDAREGQHTEIAYFSMEFGVHESIPLFAGGLGILAGDHLKAASDKALPLVGVGLLYRHGYFRQFLSTEGWQQEEYPEINFFHLPVRRARDASGKRIHISIEGPEGNIIAAVWRIAVGRVPLFLLDTNLPENSPEIRNITSRLYAGEDRIRLAQEVLLGIGGLRALEAVNIKPMVCHINEGHAAFVSLERLAQIISEMKVDLPTAMEIVPRATVFTTHTPVPAGHDEFPAYLVRPYLNSFEKRLGVSVDEILSWGQAVPNSNGPVNMSVLALRMSQYRNGVSKLHGKVARRMWSHLWPDMPEKEVPIKSVTNGVHIASWISHENALLFDRYIGPDWRLHPSSPDIIRRIDDIYEEELWRAHEMSRSRLIRTCRKLMIEQYTGRNAPKSVIKELEAALDPDALTIGFSRRFASYKRAHLLFSDTRRLKNIITSKTCPVQFVFSGKAHPRDNEGKGLIQRVVEFARDSEVRHRVVFIENYDIHIARHLVHGADIWLNTPRRPLEACGTSGMKAAINGVLNVSVLDGWWCEGYSDTVERGWRIGNGEEYSDHAYQDAVESQALYNILENDVIPCFYERIGGGLPSRWIKMMKASMKMGMQQFCSHRMVAEYESLFYAPAANRYAELIADNAQGAKQLAAQRRRLKEMWKSIRIEPPKSDVHRVFRVGESMPVRVEVYLGELLPDEVEVEFYYGILKSVDRIGSGRAERMLTVENLGNGKYIYACDISCRAAGRYGFTARVIPRGDDWIKFTPGFVKWA